MARIYTVGGTKMNTRFEGPKMGHPHFLEKERRKEKW